MPAPYAVPHNRDPDAIIHHSIASGEAWAKGALVLLDSGEDLAEVAADPAEVLGWAMVGVTAGDLIGEMAGLGLDCPVYVAQENRKAWMSGDNDPVKADINQVYGAVVDGDGIWTVDGTETTALVFYVHQIDLTRNLYLVSIVAAARQADPT